MSKEPKVNITKIDRGIDSTKIIHIINLFSKKVAKKRPNSWEYTGRKEREFTAQLKEDQNYNTMAENLKKIEERIDKLESRKYKLKEKMRKIESKHKYDDKEDKAAVEAVRDKLESLENTFIEKVWLVKDINELSEVYERFCTELETIDTNEYCE